LYSLSITPDTRLARQLTAYQVKFGIISAESILGPDNESSGLYGSAQHLHEMNFLIPLFLDYDSKIAVLEAAVNPIPLVSSYSLLVPTRTSKRSKRRPRPSLKITIISVLSSKRNLSIYFRHPLTSRALLDIYKGGKSEENLITGFCKTQFFQITLRPT
jgi:hypothetical protein